MTPSGQRDRQERLIVHRELQLLRAAGSRPRGGKRVKRAWVAERVRKLDQAQRARKR